MSDKHNDGGPAHPVVGTVGPIGRIEATGISIRDYFAGQALAGFMAHGDLMGMSEQKGKEHGLTVLRRACYEIADALLAERAQA